MNRNERNTPMVLFVILLMVISGLFILVRDDPSGSGASVRMERPEAVQLSTSCSEPGGSEVEKGGTDIFTDAGTRAIEDPIVYENSMMSYSGLVSAQKDGNYPFESEPADDFILSAPNTKITGVEWVGGYWNGGVGSFPMKIRFYNDRGDLNAPGTLIDTFDYADGDLTKSQLQGGSTTYIKYFVDLPSTMSFNADTKYWISIQGVGNFPPQSGFGYHSSPIKNHMSVFKSAFFGFNDWTNSANVYQQSDLCFQFRCGAGAAPGEWVDVWFEDFSPNYAWTTQGSWEIDALGACSGGYNGADPTSDHTDTSDNKCLGTNVPCTFSGYGTYWATSPEIDMSKYDDAVKVQYFKHDHTDYPGYQYWYFEVKDSVGTWHRLFEGYYGGGCNDNSWKDTKFTVTEYAAGNPTFQLRWGYTNNGGVFTVAGSNIDDVLVTAWQEFASYEETFTEDIFDAEYLYEGAWSKYSSHEEGRNDRVADITDLAGLLEGDGYDDESGATSCWLMDKGLTRGENDNLNELIMHLGLMEVDFLNLSFATRAFGDDITPDPMPASFDGHDDSDGVAISNDGINWHRLWQYEDSLSNWEYKEELNITEVWPEGEFDDLEDIYIKFQQFGDGTVGDPLNQDGILWDALYLFSPEGGRFIFQAPQVKVDWEITSDDIYATDQGDENDPGDDSATVTVDILGYGDTSVLESDIVGADFKVRFTKNDDAGLILNNIVADDFDDYESNGNVHTWTIDEVETEQEFTITFDVSKSGPFFDSIGTLEYRYEQWDYVDEDSDIVDWTPLEEIPVTIRSVMDSLDSVELAIDDHIGGERIISNKPDGSELTIVSYDQFGEEMPAQTFDWDWVTTPSEGIAEVVPNLAEENKADIFAEPLTVGKTVEIIVDHDPMGYQYTFPAETITWGPPSKPEATINEPYIVGERGVIGITLADDYGNRVPVWEGPMYVEVGVGAEVIWDDALETDEDPGSPYYEKEFYYFGVKDKGGHDFIFTPMTWNDNGQSPTRISFWTPGMDPLTITIYPVAGDVKHLWPKQDTANMASDDYFAGDEYYLTIQGLDKLFNPSETWDTPILVTHNSYAAGELEPEPWKSEGDVYLDMVDGFATNWNDDEMLRLPFIFYKAETVELTFRQRTNLGINNSEYKFPILVNPTSVKVLESTPAGTEEDPVSLMTSEEQEFTVDAYDEYGNEIPSVLRDLDWNVDSGIDPVDGMWDMNSPENRNTFKGIEYFAPEDFEGLIGEVADGYLRDDDGDILYSYKDGLLHATVTGPIEPPVGGPCPREATEVIDIPIRVLNDYDVWLDEDEVWPGQVLANEQLELTANIHYKIPADELVGDLLEIKIKFSLVELDENGEEKSVLFDLHQENIRLLNLYEKPEGIYPFHHTVPAEFFRDYVDYVKKGMKDGDKKPNYIKVEIEDVAGGSDMKIFEKSLENDNVIVELFVVVPTPAKSPSFAPSIAFVGLALLGLAVGSTFFSRRKRKGRGKDDDAVSPVIAIILMVAITIVLAGVLWLWVSGLVATGKEETLYKGFQSEWIEKTENKDYQLLIKAVDGKNELSVEDLRFTLYALDKSDQTGGQHKVTNVYGKPISDQTFISFHDGDHDGMLSIGDRFIIKSFEHVNDDGTIPDGDLQGKAKEGFTFELRAGKTQLFETKVK